MKTSSVTPVKTKEELMAMGLKDMIALAESLGIKYAFHKKDALAELILGASPAAEASAAVEEKPKADKKAPKADKKADKKAAPVVAVDDVPSEEEVAEVEVDEAPEEMPDATEVIPQSTGKKGGKGKGAVAPPIEKASKAPASTAADIEALKARPDVAAILSLKEKDGTDATKSEKVRRLHFRLDLTVGQTAKVLGIHYSFAFCVVSAFRSMHDTKKAK